MSEYWVSHKKYFCKYCNIYIADDVPSRRQHESGLRHNGNVERFVRGLYKEGEKRKQDLEEEKRDMVRVEQAAQAAFARDVGAGLVRPGSSSSPGPSTSAAARKPAPKPSSPYANYSTAESLGYIDPDVERLKAEAERRRTQGVAGEWEVVSIVEHTTQIQQEEEPAPHPAEDASKKRSAEQDVHEDSRAFKLRRRTVGVGLGELYDPGVIPIKVKKKEEPAEPAPAIINSTSIAQADSSKATAKPKWSARGWNRPGERTAGTKQTSEGSGLDGEASGIKVEEDVKQEEQPSIPDIPPLPDVKPEPLADVKAEEAEAKSEANESAAPSSGGSLFRKRKLPAGGTGSRGRRT